MNKLILIMVGSILMSMVLMVAYAIDGRVNQDRYVKENIEYCQHYYENNIRECPYFDSLEQM